MCVAHVHVDTRGIQAHLLIPSNANPIQCQTNTTPSWRNWTKSSQFNPSKPNRKKENKTNNVNLASNWATNWARLQIQTWKRCKYDSYSIKSTKGKLMAPRERRKTRLWRVNKCGLNTFIRLSVRLIHSFIIGNDKGARCFHLHFHFNGHWNSYC